MSKNELKDAAMSGLLAAIGIVICWFVIVVFSSCGATHTTQAQGRTVIVTTDTTVINHGGTLTIKTR